MWVRLCKVGFFNRDDLGDIGKKIKEKKYNEILLFLKRHVQAEKELRGDLIGLLGETNKYDSAIRRAENALMELADPKERNSNSETELRIAYANVRKSVERIEALMAKIWKVDRRKIE